MDLDLLNPTTLVATLTVLLVVDTILGAVAAWAGGSFSWEYLYAVGRTKGLVLFQIAVLSFASVSTTLLDFNIVGLDTDPFALLSMPLAISLAASLIASIANNIGKRDTTAPQGVSPVNVQTPPDKV